MSPLNVTLSNLISDLDSELPHADPLVKIGAAQQRSHTLADLGDQLVGYYVSQARESGASWSQIGDAIGVSKQAAQQRWVPPMYERFTQRARDAVVRTADHARRHQADQIGPEHLLLGLIDDEEGLAGKIVAALAGPLDALRERIEGALPAGDGASPAKLPFNPVARQIVERAGTVAQEYRHNYIGTEHLLLSLVIVLHTDREAPYLDRAGLTVEAVREKFQELLAGYLAAKKARQAE